jgi:hypothetical protein
LRRFLPFCFFENNTPPLRYLPLTSLRFAVTVASAGGGGNGVFPLHFAGRTGLDALGGLKSHGIIRWPGGHVIRPTSSIFHPTALVWVVRCIITSAELLAPCMDWGASPSLDFMLLPAVPEEGGKAGPSPPLRCWQGYAGGDSCPLFCLADCTRLSTAHPTCVLVGWLDNASSEHSHSLTDGGALPSLNFTPFQAARCKKWKAGPPPSLHVRHGPGESISTPRIVKTFGPESLV